MLHILLLILKIIGVILAVILGIVILLACIVLFVPVRYEITGKCGGTPDSLEMAAKATWLLHLVRADVCFKEQKLRWKLRAAWARKDGGQERAGPEGGITEDAHRKEKKKDEGKEEIPETREKSKEELEIGEEERKKSVEEIPEAKSEAHETIENVEEPESDGGKRPGIIERIRGILQKIKSFFQSFCKKIRLLAQKKDKLAGFIRDEAHVGAFLKAKKEAFKLLNRLKPSKLAARLRIGFSDPCTTGKALAGLSLLYPVVGEHLDITPDFENRVLQGDIYVKGRIHGYYFLVLCWNLVWCRNVRTTFKDIKRFEF